MHSLDKNILIGCYEVPGYGGAATAAYQLFESFQKDGLNVSYLNIIGEQDPDYFRFAFGESYGNPKSLRNVHNCILNASVFQPQPVLTNLIHDLVPDLMIGIGFIAAHVMKHACPEQKLIFMTSGFDQVSHTILRNLAKDLISLEKLLVSSPGRPHIHSIREAEAFGLSDLIVVHSESVLSLSKRYFPLQSGKIYSNVIGFAEWIYGDAMNYSALSKEFCERDIDVLFVSSSWNRPVKNYRFVRKLLPRLIDLRVHIVGSTEEIMDEATYHGLVNDRKELFSLLGRAKTVVCPSLFDAAPGILFEASALGCNIVASKNCGNWRICNEELLVEPFTVKQFLDRIRISQTHKFEDLMDLFLRSCSYEDLKETIALV